jgi:nucleotide-binding universal stress UspA family protein
MFKKILLCTDGSERSIDAARVAADLAECSKGQLAIIHVASIPVTDEPFPGAPALPKSAIEAYLKAIHVAVFERTLPPVKDARLRFEIIEETGDPGDVISRTADRQEFDLIVMGSRGLRDDKIAALGSVSQEVVQKAHCPVLIVK